MSAPAEPVAVIGLGARYPGAGDVAAYWDVLAGGRECLTTYSEEALVAAGYDERTIRDPSFVARAATIAGVEDFDAGFFGLGARDAAVRSPHQRVLLEVAHAALEDAGCEPLARGSRAGVFVGGNLNPYEWLHLLASPETVAAVGEAAIQIGNDLDYLATSIAYMLDLRGPGVDVQSACSTSLLAVHLAVRALVAGECDLALAGGVSIRLPLVPGMKAEIGYLHQPGGIWSADGYTRTFDARASGTVFGSGAGAVVLKRLRDALADGDPVYAVVLGSAANNDGADKVGYTAPSVEGQARVVAAALAGAGVGADGVGMVEAHGTATTLGDPIEVAGLTQAFGAHGRDAGWCAIGSVKSNIGHLSAAAGVAGLTKAVLALHHGLIPRTLNFASPNPRIDFASSPFRVASEAIAWPRGPRPRRAGVSAFGIGGTNVHVVLEEAPAPPPPEPSGPWKVLALSARTPTALDAATDRLAGHLAAHPGLDVADVAHTLQVGRAAHERRRAVVCRDREQALETIASRDPRRFLTGAGAAAWPGAVFLFPGQGAQHAGMGAGLAGAFPTFRTELDRCCELVAAHFGRDLRPLLFPPPEHAAEAGRALARTEIAQPALFALEHALARLWISWGVEPRALIGHSVGEYVAATLAGVFDLETAVRLVVERGRLAEGLPEGAMLAVPLPEDDVVPLLGPGLDLAAVNGPRLCTVSGPEEAIAGLEAALAGAGIGGRRLVTSRAFHSAATEAILEPFAALVAGARPRPPAVPFVSNVTGTWITPAEATDPRYWARHLRETVRFSAGLATLLQGPGVLLEVGPGQALTGMARQQPAAAGRVALPSLGPPHDAAPEPSVLLGTLARLWLAGAPVEWRAVTAGERRRRVHLPTYPFERGRHWAEQVVGERPRRPRGSGRRRLADWFSAPVWRQAPPLVPAAAPPAGRSPWLVLVDETGLAEGLAARLEALGQDVARVVAGARFERRGEGVFAVAPGSREDFDALLAALAAGGRLPRTILHAWTLTGAPVETAPATVERAQRLGFTSLLVLGQALAAAELSRPARIAVVTDGVFDVDGAAARSPLKATLLGPCRVLPREQPDLACQVIDVDPARLDVDRLLAEVCRDAPVPEVAHRGRRRWTPGFAPVPLDETSRRPALRERGTYLVTGGLGGLGGVFAEHLARACRARLVLVARAVPPPREEWERWLAEHGERDRTSRRIAAVRALEGLGAEVMIAGADVADPERMAAVLAEAEARFGPVRGVIHAAGVAGGGMAQVRDLAAAEAVLRPKVAGTAVLWSLLKDRDLDFLVLCSSIIAALGSFGQVDYCAANAFLDVFAAAVEGPALSLAWDGWEEVGMAVETEVPGLLRELRRGLRREREGHPLLHWRVSGEGTAPAFAAELGPATCWALDEHRIAGRPVLPGTAYLEMAQAAFRAATGAADGPLELRDVVFLRPLAVGDGEVREVRTTLEHGAAGASFSVSSTGPDGEVEHAGGRVAAAPAAPAPVHDLEACRRRCPRPRALGLRDGGEGSGPLVSGGPRWDTVREVWDGEGEAVARIGLEAGLAGDLGAYWLHPSLLDGATAFGLVGTDRQGRYLPIGYGRVTLRAPLPSGFWSHLRWLPEEGSRETLACEVTLMDEAGVELARVERFLLRRVDAATVRASVAPAGAAAPGDPAPARRAAGIRPEEGVEALLRALGERPAPALVVSPLDLEERLRRAAELARPAVEGAPARTPAAAPAGERTLGTPYVAPETEVEEALATLLAQVVGVDRVGVEDDFFALGGSSLTAVQFAGRVRDGFQIELGIQHVLERPTVRRLAEVVEERLLARVAAMSEEEVRALLAREG